MLKWGRRQVGGRQVAMGMSMLLLAASWALEATAAVALDAGAHIQDTHSCSTGEDCQHLSSVHPAIIDTTASSQPASTAAPPAKHIHVQDMIVTLITVCTVFCMLLAFVILKKPVPRLLDAIPREPLCWAHSDNLFVFTDLESDSIMIKNAGLTDIDLSACKLRIEHATDRGIYYNFSFPEGYLLVAGTTVSVCYRTAAKFVAIPRRRVDRLDSRTCPRLRWPPHLDGPVDSALDSAALFDSESNQIACESVILQPASFTDSERRMSTDSSDAAFFHPAEPTTGIAECQHANVTSLEWFEVSMQEHSRKENPRSAEEWKRKYLTETKVNQELGRRLRDLKQRLTDENASVDRLRRQLDSRKVEPTMTQSCEKCAKLELEVSRLRKLLAQHNIEVNGQESLSIDPAPPQHEDQDVINPLRRSHSILVRQQSGRIQCLRDMLDELTPRVDGVDSARRKSLVMLSQPFASPGKETDQVSSQNQTVAPSPPQQPTPATKPPPISTKEQLPRPSNQAHDVNTALENALHGIEDKSLGDLFKYAIVLTGPMPRPKKSALSAFFKNADFRRSKSLQDGSNVSGDISQLRKASAAAALAPVSVQEFVSGENGRPKPSDGEKMVPPGSPMKKAGWLSNIQTRFRSASTEAPPSPHNKPEAVKTEAPDTVAKAAASAPAKVDPTKPRMLAVSPPPGKGGVAELEGLVEICFPYGEKLPPLSDFSVTNLKRTLQERHRTYRSPDSTFVLTIASATNHKEITYAVCVHFPLFPDEDSGTGPEHVDADGDKLPSHGCISILSNYPFFSLFFKVVFGIASIWESRRKEYVQDFAIALKEKKAPPTPLTVKDFVTHFEGVMKRMKEMRVPAMGGWTRLVLAPQYTPLSFHRPHSESVKAERRMLVLEYAAPMLFALLSVDQVLFLLGCLCCERKVLVVSDHANIVSCCVLALITLLEPLTWAGPVITLLPPRLDELLEAPVPLIAGRVSINSGAIPNFSTLTKPMNGVIEMNMDQNNLCMHEEDLMRYHELKLPGCDALVHELQQHSSLLFERHLSPDFPSVEQIHACDIICTRIHRHMQSICSLATGEATTLDATSPLYCASPRRQAGATASTDPVWTRRCSEAVQDYILRFQDTQMFSMFKLQRQDEREEEALDLDDDDDDDEEDGPERSSEGSHQRRKNGKYEMLDEEDSGEEAEDAAECTETEALFEDEAVTYETAL